MQDAAQRNNAEGLDLQNVRVVFEDPGFLVVDKPAGMPSHPLTHGETGTLVHALQEQYPEIKGIGYARFADQSQREAGLVHRLDNHTSGLLLVARTQESFERLRAALAEGAIEKRYRLMCEGSVEQNMSMRLPIAPHPKNRRKVKVCRTAVLAAKLRARAARTDVTNARVLESVSDVQVRATFARRHQIRAHLSDAGHPLLGDVLYGGLHIPGLSRFFLHAEFIELRHPFTHAPLSFRSLLPSDLEHVMRGLELRAPFVRDQILARGVVHRRVLAAMQLVPREMFVPVELRDQAYDDSALAIGLGQTISQPFMVARTLELAEIAPSDRVLEVGAGSGYQAAVLGVLAREVVTLERIEELAARAHGALLAAGITNTVVVHSDGTLGHPPRAPYDAIVVAAGAPSVPSHLLAQLAPGGRLVIPVGGADEQRLCVVRRKSASAASAEPEFREWWHDRCTFVPLIGDQGWHHGAPAS